MLGSGSRSRWPASSHRLRRDHYGVTLNEALLNLATRVPVGDLRYFVIAVLIQRETGGNLAEILDSIASLVRARLQLFDKVKVLSAEDVCPGGFSRCCRLHPLAPCRW